MRELIERLRSTVYSDGSQGIEHEAADALERMQEAADGAMREDRDYLKARLEEVCASQIAATRERDALAARLAEAQDEADRRTREVEACYTVQRDLAARLAEADVEIVRLKAEVFEWRDACIKTSEALSKSQLRPADRAPAVTWRRTVLPCLDCGVDRNTEQHKPGCRHDITNSASVPPIPPSPPPARDVTGRTGPPKPPKTGSNWIPRGYHMRGKP